MRNECEWHRSPCHLLVVMHACLQPVERITEASKKLSVGRSRQHRQRQHRAWEEWGPLLRQPAKHTHPAPPSACCVASFVCARAASPCVPPSGTLRHARIRWAPRPSRCTVSVTRTQNPCHGSFPMEDGDARVSCVRSVCRQGRCEWAAAAGSAWLASRGRQAHRRVRVRCVRMRFRCTTRIPRR